MTAINRRLRRNDDFVIYRREASRRGVGFSIERPSDSGHPRAVFTWRDRSIRLCLSCTPSVVNRKRLESRARKLIDLLVSGAK